MEMKDVTARTQAFPSKHQIHSNSMVSSTLFSMMFSFCLVPAFQLFLGPLSSLFQADGTYSITQKMLATEGAAL